jgi:hypothetical protein
VEEQLRDAVRFMFDNAPPSLKFRRTREKYKKQFFISISLFYYHLLVGGDANKGKVSQRIRKEFRKGSQRKEQEALHFTSTSKQQKQNP